MFQLKSDVVEASGGKSDVAEDKAMVLHESEMVSVGDDCGA